MGAERKRFSDYDSMDDWLEKNPEEGQGFLLAVLRDHEQMTEEAWEKACRIRWTKMLLDEMVEDGLLKRDRYGKYKLTPKGRRARGEA